MKKWFALLVNMLLVICLFAIAACDTDEEEEEPLPSTAITYDALIRENYASDMEKENDKTLTHPVEIPEGAATVEVDGETYTVIRTIEEFKEMYHSSVSRKGNYVLGNDLNIKDYNCQSYVHIFQGHFNGNNYKVYSTEEDGGLSGSLFSEITDATVENIIFSASDGSCAFDNSKGRPYLETLLVRISRNSTIRNCINYWQPDTIYMVGGLIGSAIDSKIENCINYSDYVIFVDGAIVGDAVRSEIKGCKNYGNLTRLIASYPNSFGLGGIVGEAREGCVIQDCENYGKLGGVSSVGGIVGLVTSKLFNFNFLDTNEYPNKNVIRNCKNYGDIYLLKEADADKLEKTSSSRYPNVILIGGIAGCAVKLENCKNEGNFYGFENLGAGVNVDYTGGVVGIAKEVTDCSSTGTMVIQKGRAKNVGNIYGLLLS